MSTMQVRNIMGKPDSSRLGTLPRQPFFGPRSSLAKLLKPGEAFEEWRYTDDQTTYFIWFAKEGTPTNSWKVIAKMSYPVGAVF